MELVALEAVLREKLSTSSVQNLEGFPCGSYSDFLTQHKSGQLQVLTAYDHGAFETLASGSERVMHYLLTWSPALVSVSLVIASIIQRNFWLLLGIPLALLGFFLTTPGLMRSFGYPLLLIVGGSAVYSWFQGNPTAACVLGAYAAVNFLVDVARQQCSMILEAAIERSEIILVWLYLKGSIVIRDRQGYMYYARRPKKVEKERIDAARVEAHAHADLHRESGHSVRNDTEDSFTCDTCRCMWWVSYKGDVIYPFGCRLQQRS